MLAFSVSLLGAQEEIPFLEWSHPRGEQEMFTTAKTTTDHAGNSVLIGQTIGANGDYDILLVKQDRDGQEIWNLQVSGTGNGDDFGTAVCVDANNVVYATGTVDNGSLNGLDTWVCAISPDGTVLWETEYDTGSSFSEVGTSIDIDSQGGVYVGGSTSAANSSFDLMGLKLNQLDGSVTWASSWDFVGLIDGATATRCTGSKVIFTGGAQASATSWRGVSVAYAANDGQLLGEYVTNGGDVSVDVINDVQISPSGDILVAGSVQEIGGQMQQVIIKLSPYMEELWSIQSGPENGDGDFEANGIGVTELGEVVVCGTHSTPDSSNVVLSKYTSAGSLIWQEQTPLMEHNSQSAVDLTLDTETNSAIVLTNDDLNGNSDVGILKYSNDGSLVWRKSYNGTMNGEDVAHDICSDSEGGFILAIQSNGINGIEYIVQRYTAHSVMLPADDGTEQGFSFFEENIGQVLAVGENPSSVDNRSRNSSPMIYTQDQDVIFSYAVGDTVSAYTQNVRLQFGKDGDTGKFKGSTQIGFHSNYYHNGIPGSKREQVIGYKDLILPQFIAGVNIILRHKSSTTLSILFDIEPDTDPSNISFDLISPLNYWLSDETVVWESLIGLQSLQISNHQTITPDGSINTPISEPDFQINQSGTISFTGLELDTVNRQLLELSVGEALVIPNVMPLFDCGWIWSTYLPVSSWGANSFDIKFNHTGYIHDVGQSNNILDFAFTSDIETILYEDLTTMMGYILTLKNEATPLWQTFIGSYDAIIECNAVECSTSPSEYDILVAGTLEGINYPINFPITGDCFQCNPGGGNSEGFVTRLANNTGQLEWSSFLGGTNDDFIESTCYSESGNSMFVVGKSNSLSNFPIQSPATTAYIQPSISQAGNFDGFISEIDWQGNLTWSTFLGTNQPSGSARVCDCAAPHSAQPKLVVTGSMKGAVSNPVIGNLFSPTNGFPICAQSSSNTMSTDNFNSNAWYVTEFDLDNYFIKWSTLLPSNGEMGVTNSFANSIASLDDKDVVVGTTIIPENFPVIGPAGAFQKNSLSGDTNDAFVMEFQNRKLMWSTLIGGAHDDYSADVDMAPNGEIYIVGNTKSPPMPPDQQCSNTSNPIYFPICSQEDMMGIDDQIDGPLDAFIVKFNNDNTLGLGTYYGGNSIDAVWGMDLKDMTYGGAYDPLLLGITGTSMSDDNSLMYPNPNWSPTQLQGSFVSLWEGFMAILGTDEDCFPVLLPPNPGPEEGNPLDVELSTTEFELISISPVPVRDIAYITWPEHARIQEIQIFDITGKFIINQYVPSGSIDCPIDLSFLSPGYYFAKSPTLIGNPIKFFKQ